ncbi:MAG: VCBS repeat-containing protein [Planctomycetes bacterium]|nr:VCBS repeat-containing protein [Planctomycetota bacterium]
MITWLTCLLASFAQDDPFVRSVIEPRAVLEGRVYHDADGDGLTDVILFDRYRVWTYLQRPDHTFPRTDDHVIELARGTTVFEFGNVDGQPGAELVELVDGRLQARDLRTGEPRDDTRLPTPTDCLFHGLENFPATPFWYLIDDPLRGDGDEVVLPTERGLFLYEPSGPRAGQSLRIPYAYEARLGIDARGLEGRLSKSVSVPLLAYVDLGEPNWSVAISSGRTLVTYDLLTNPQRWEDPVRLVVRSRATFARDDRGRDLLFSGKHESPDVLASWRTGDLNGDGQVDLYRFEESERTLLFVYGTPGERTLTRPDDVLPLAAAPTEVHLRDGNGDGRLDLYLLEEKPVQTPKQAALAFMEAKLRGHVSCRLTVFPNQGGNTPFLPNPSWIGTYPMRPKIGTKNGAMYLGVRMIVNTDSDFDGDGVLDLMRQPADGKLEFLRGSRAMVYARETWATVAIDSEEPYQDIAAQTKDLDGDGRDDVILHYRAWDTSPREKMILLMSRLRDK